MSVVNQMLNDLEKREASQVGLHANYQPATRRRRYWPLLAIALLIISMVTAGLFMFIEQSPDPAPPIEPVVISQPAATEPAPPQTLELQQTSPQPTLPQPTPPIVEEDPTKANTPIENQDQGLVVEPVEVLSEAANVAIETPKVKAEPPPSSFSVASSTPVKTQPHYQVLVADAMARNDTANAQQLLSQWIKAEPDNLLAHKKLAAVAFAAGQMSRADAVLQHAYTLAPNDPSIRLMLARLNQRLGNLDTAWQSLQLSSIDVDFLHFRAAFAREYQQTEQAQQDYQQLTELNEQDYRAWLGLAVVSDNLQQPDKALQAYAQASRFVGENEEVRQYVQSRIASLSKQIEGRR